MRALFRRSFVALLLVSGCADVGSSDPADPADDALATGKLTDKPVAHIVYRMPRGSTSTASIRTLPNATCRLHLPEQAAGANGQLRVFSDDDGVARIQLDHLDPTVAHGQLTLDCADEPGARLSHTIEIVIDDSAAPQAPAKYRTTGKPMLAKLDVPATALTDHDLDVRHYPPRPNPVTNPTEYDTWLQLVSGSPTLITPHVVTDQERVHSTRSTSGNWSGYVITTPSTAPIYAWIYGEWNVPRAYAESGFSSWDHSSFWVGIDGWGSNDVVQDGTDQNTLTFFWVQSSSYDAWVEWYPLSSQTVSNFPVNPGDRLHAWTWVKDANGNYSTNVQVGWFYMWNQTQNVYVYYSINKPSGANFSGHSAEWVMERPTVLGSTSSLANYSWAQMTNALAYDLWGGSHLYGGDSSDTSWNVTMMNGSTVLSTVAPVNSSTMQFTFHNHD